MSDWLTLRTEITELVDSPNDGDMAARALARSLRFHRKHHMWFNEGKSTITTVADQYEYALPTDFVNVIGEPIYVPASSPTSRIKLRATTSQEAEEFRYHEADTSTLSSRPIGYAVFNETVFLWPAPSDANDTVELRYVKDLGTPSVQFSGDKGWQVLDPGGGGAPVSPTYTNAWLTDGQDALRERALYYMQRDYFANDKRAAVALQAWAEAFAALRKESSRRKGVVRIRGHF